MCKPSERLTSPSPTSVVEVETQLLQKKFVPIGAKRAPSALAKFSCVGILVSIMAVWGKFTFVPEDEQTFPDCMHSYKVPLALTAFYLISLPLLKKFTDTMLKEVDVKALLLPSMVIYNVSQVILNGWMVYRFIHALTMKGHPFIGDLHSTISSFVVWVHYCDKYLEFFDTYFMVLRGRMDQVSFLHVYHHFTIAWAWWIGLIMFPQGDAYFGALLNSIIHVFMYAYYSLSLLKIACPWKKYLTQLQLAQFTSVILYSIFSMRMWSVEDRAAKHFIAIGTQLFEMSTLFILFYYFYQKSYSKKKADKLTSKASKEQ